MSMPTYDELTLPLLKLVADDRQHAIFKLRRILAQQFQLTPEECMIKLLNGSQFVYENRMNWASRHLSAAKLLSNPRAGYYKITERGKDVIADSPSILNAHYLQRFEEYRAFIEATVPIAQAVIPINDSSSFHQSNPNECIRKACIVIEANLKDDLLNKIQQMNSSRFEWLVLQLLHVMGYGGSIRDVKGVPRGPDGGIDGLIEEDKLGLNTIYIQAKRWQNGSNVGREKIQAFQGALAGIGARKGVFITTSAFTQNARTYVERLRDSKIILIDGQKLAQLMIEHNVGVSIQETFQIKRINEDFFTEAEL